MDKLCKCGCGISITSKWQKYHQTDYIKGHGRKNRPNSTEHNMKIAESNKTGQTKKCLFCNKDFYVCKVNLERKKYCSKYCYTQSMIGRKLSKESIEKSRLALIGHSVSEETKRKISKANGGNKNGSWKEVTLDKIKRAIRKRDNYICLLCNIHQEKFNKSLDVHHIDYSPENNLPQNMITLCHPCHARTNKSNRKFWKQHCQSILSLKYNYKYTDNQEILINLITQREVK